MEREYEKRNSELLPGKYSECTLPGLAALAWHRGTAWCLLSNVGNGSAEPVVLYQVTLSCGDTGNVRTQFWLSQVTW